MSDLEKQMMDAVHLAAASPEVGKALRLATRRLVHDLNNSLGVLSLELYNLTMVREDMQAAIGTGDVAGLQQGLEELALACQSLKAMDERAKGIIRVLSDAVRSLPAGGE